MGKSAAADFLVELGWPVVDTDQLARQLTEPGQPALAEISRQFGPEFIGPDGRLLRDRMAALVFQDAAARKRLEEILHPAIRAAWLAVAGQWRASGLAAGVVVIPLLYETEAEREVDRVICVACGAETQRRRLAVRGWTPEHVQRRITAQWPIEKKMNRADFVIWSEGSLAVLRAQLARVMAAI
jgi:dephospho-CoA kinase